MSKLKIIKRDKKVETNTIDKYGAGGAAWLLLPLNIIPKKSPPSLLGPSL